MARPSLKTTVGGVPLTSCVYNASGPRSGTSTALGRVCQSAAGGVLAKSATIERQGGNPQPRVHHTADNNASFNSEGLPNSGIDYYISENNIADAMKDPPAGSENKPYMISISGKTLEDNLTMLKRIKKAPTLSKIKAVELNLACPNVIGKPIIAYDFDQMKDILKQVCSALKDTSIVLGVKLPPYLDGPHFARAAEIINKRKDIIKYVATINTLGNSLAIDAQSEAPFIQSNDGFAGMSGPAVKYTALANVRKLRLVLADEIDIVGVGGVASGLDAFELILCGATAVQVGTCHWTEGPTCFDRICEELQDLMENKGYESIQDFKGKLKEWSREGATLSRTTTKERNKQTTKIADTKIADTETTAAVPSTSVDSSNTTSSPILLAVLIAIIAILLADKVAAGSLLPF